MTAASMDPTERFSTRVEDYARHRPSYPPELVPWLRERGGLAAGAVVADVGSGTGIFARQLLDAELTVVGIEPNSAMRRVAEESLGAHPRFTSLAGRAEATRLEAASVELVTAAQAFHWFDRQAARREFARILRPGGLVALVWNARTAATPFLRAYEDHLQRFGLEYGSVDHRGLQSSNFEAFFGPGGFQVATFTNRQVLDFEGLRGRHYSSSYTPPPDHPEHAADLRALRHLFDAHEERGSVTIEYETKVYCGGLE